MSCPNESPLQMARIIPQPPNQLNTPTSNIPIDRSPTLDSLFMNVPNSKNNSLNNLNSSNIKNAKLLPGVSSGGTLISQHISNASNPNLLRSQPIPLMQPMPQKQAIQPQQRPNPQQRQQQPQLNNNNQGQTALTRGRSPTLVPCRKQIIDQMFESQEEEESQWLTETFLSRPEILQMRETSLPSTGGFSFANVSHCLTVNSMSSLNRHTILELIYQHLLAIGMYNTAEILSKESGHEYQAANDQPWNRTDLHLLSSLAVGYRENAWDIGQDQGHIYIQENAEEDFFSSPYRENPSTIWEELFNPNFNVTFKENSNGDRSYDAVKTASLKRIIIFQLMNDGKNLGINGQNEFFLCVQSITSGQHFLQHLVHMFDCDMTGTRFQPLPIAKVHNVQAAVLSLVKCWVTFHGNFVGKKILNLITDFLDRILGDRNMPYAHQLARMIKDIIVNERFVNTRSSPQDASGKLGLLATAPDPMINMKNLKIFFSPELSLFDIEPIEVARQLTLIYHEKFSLIPSLEFMSALKSRKATIQTPTLMEYFIKIDHLSQLVGKSFLETDSKKTAYIYLSNVARQLFSLGNFSSLATLLRMLLDDDFKLLGTPNDATVMELHSLYDKCGDLDNAGTKAQNINSNSKQNVNNNMSNVKKDGMTVYEKLIDERSKSYAPTIPNVYAELKKIDKGLIRQPDFINGLMNWEKIREFSKKCLLFYRFQNNPYNLIPIPQIQKVLLREVDLPYEEFEKQMTLQIKNYMNAY